VDAGRPAAKVEHNFLGPDDRLGVNYRFNWGSYQYRLVFPPVVCCARAECNAR